MVLALQHPARKIVVNWSPSVISTLITIGGFVIVGVAALGQWRWNAVKTWRELAEANAAMVARLQAEKEELLLRMDTLEKSVAYVQRQNYILQGELSRHGIELERHEVRNFDQHHPREED